MATITRAREEYARKRETSQLPHVGFASIALAFDDLRRHVVWRAGHGVRGRPRDNCVQTLCSTKVSQLDMAVMITQDISTWQSQAEQAATGD